MLDIGQRNDIALLFRRCLSDSAAFLNLGVAKVFSGGSQDLNKNISLIEKNSEIFKIFAAIAFQLCCCKLPTGCRPTTANILMLCAG